MSSLRYYKNCIKREKPFGADKCLGCCCGALLISGSCTDGLKSRVSLPEVHPSRALKGIRYVAAGGAFPIRIKDLSTGPIGTIIVSGMPDTADQWV